MAEDLVTWHARPRNYERERREFATERVPARSHPLNAQQKSLPSATSSVLSNGVSSRNVSKSSLSSASSRVSVQSSGFIDPLSQAASNDEIVPVRSDSRKTGNAEKTRSREKVLGPWAMKKESILSKFTTTEKLTLTSSYLSGDDRVVTVTKSNLVADRIQSRLEQLDSFEAGSMKEMLNLSQQEYISKIDQLHNKLQEAWREDQRVTALKIAIQLAKLLSDTFPLQFYPSKFVLVTDVLETFGQLIYDRILDKSGAVFGDSSPDRTPETAKETCRNWFFKVASIRELLPRLYIEISIMRCHSFLEPKTAYLDIIPRFAKMIRGIGDILIASYLRCYLARMIIQLAPETMPRFLVLIEDFVTTAQHAQRDKLELRLSEQKLTLSSYLLLHQPALEWIVDCYARQTGSTGIQQLLALAESSRFCGLLLNCIMTGFKAELVAQRPMLICALIHRCSDEVFPTYILCRTLGLCLLGADTEPKERKKIMNEIWSVVAAQPDPQNYINAAEIWVEFCAKFFTVKEVNRILGDIIQHLLPDRAYEKCENTLVQILEKVVRHVRNFGLLLSMDKFMPFLDMLQKDEIRLEAARLMLDAYSKFERDATADPVILNGVMFACKIVHDSVSSLSSDDEKRAAAVMICGFIKRVDYGKDFEKQLAFFGDCRAAFSNLDDVTEHLVRSVNTLAMSTLSIQNSHHSRKTAAFVRACVAFSFITVPSLYDIPSQLTLYLECAQVALANQCLGQADALIKAAIQLFNGSKDELEAFGSKMRPAGRIAVEFASGLLGLLLVMPNPPEQGMLYLARGIMNTVQGLDVDVRTALQIQLLAYFSAAQQEEYQYHIEGVDSNDRLYGGDPDFLSEIEDMASTCITHLLTTFNQLEKSKQFSQAMKLAIDMVEVILCHGNALLMVDILRKLVRFAKTQSIHSQPEAKRLQALRHLVQRRSGLSDLKELFS